MNFDLFLSEHAAALSAFILFIYLIRAGKKDERENKMYIQQVWDHLHKREKGPEEDILWLLVLNTEKIERQATHLRGIFAASMAILAFLVVGSF